MNKGFTIITILAASLIATTGVRGEEPEKPRRALSILEADAVDSAAVTSLYAEFTEAFNQHDPEAMASIWAIDGDHVEPDGTVAKGRQEVEALFRKEHELIFKDAELSLSIRSVWFMRPGVALADGTYRIEGAVDPKGEPLGPREGMLTSVLLEEDGTWKVAASRLMLPVPLVWRSGDQPEAR